CVAQVCLLFAGGGDAEFDVVGDEVIEDRVRNLVADLVRVAFGDRFRSKEIILERHRALPQMSLDLRAGRDGPPTSGLAFVFAVASRPNPSAAASQGTPRR